MRLFVALNLPQYAISALQRCVNSLQPYLVEGRLTDSQNYHITLSFLGEVEENNLIYIQSAMDKVKDMAAPQLSFAGLINMRSSDIACAKLKKNADLIALQRELADALEERGFSVEHRTYRPHVTLIRKYKFSLPFPEAIKYAELSNRPFVCPTVTLYQTVFGSGGVTYRPLYTINLTQNQ